MDIEDFESVCMQMAIEKPDEYNKIIKEMQRGILTPWDMVYKIMELEYQARQERS